MARGRRSRVLSRIERAVLGAVFGFVAFVIERRVLKSIKRRGEQPPSNRTTTVGDVLERVQDT